MIIGLVGFIGAGKGAVSEILVDSHNYRNDAFAASLKDACSVMFDWPRDLLEGDTKESRAFREVTDTWWSNKLGIKDFTPRLALQLVGTDALRNHFNPDIWFLTLQNRLQKNPDQNVVISDVRFPNEFAMIKEMGGTILHIKRGKEPVWLNIAQRAISNNDADAWREMKENFPEVHFSEWAWVGEHVDHTIDNNGTLLDLARNVNFALNK